MNTAMRRKYCPGEFSFPVNPRDAENSCSVARDLFGFFRSLESVNGKIVSMYFSLDNSMFSVGMLFDI